jgi:hypothetical protein
MLKRLRAIRANIPADPERSAVVEKKVIRSSKDRAKDFSEEWVKVAAYYIWQKEGCPFGHDIENWNMAKAELANISQSKTKPAKQRQELRTLQPKARRALKRQPSLNS